MVAAPPGLKFGKVTAQILVASPDTQGDSDRLPDIIAPGGTVKFNANLNSSTSTVDKVILLPKTINATLSATDGKMYDADGLEGVFLVASDSPGYSGAGFTWTAEFTFADGSKLAPITFPLTSDSVIDLSQVVSVAASAGTSVVATPGITLADAENRYVHAFPTTASFTYDSNGNLATETYDGITTYYTYVTATPNAAIATIRRGTTTRTMTYDANGRLTGIA